MLPLSLLLPLLYLSLLYRKQMLFNVASISYYHQISRVSNLSGASQSICHGQLSCGYNLVIIDFLATYIHWLADTRKLYTWFHHFMSPWYPIILGQISINVFEIPSCFPWSSKVSSVRTTAGASLCAASCSGVKPSTFSARCPAANRASTVRGKLGEKPWEKMTKSTKWIEIDRNSSFIIAVLFLFLFFRFLEFLQTRKFRDMLVVVFQKAGKSLTRTKSNRHIYELFLSRLYPLPPVSWPMTLEND